MCLGKMNENPREDNAMSLCFLSTSPLERTASTIVLSTRADVDPNGGCFDVSPRFRPLQVFGPCCDADSWTPQLVPCTCQCLMVRMTRHRPFHNDVLMCQFRKFWKSKSRCVDTRTDLRTQQYLKIWNAPSRVPKEMWEGWRAVEEPFRQLAIGFCQDQQCLSSTGQQVVELRLLFAF